MSSAAGGADGRARGHALAGLLRGLRRIEEAVLSLLLAGTVLLAVFQVFLRNVLHSGMPWADSLLRVLVLWLGFAGAMVASRDGRHIRIDVVSRHLAPTARRRLRRATELVAAAVCAAASWHGFKFVRLEFQDQVAAFGQVPVWVVEAVIPLGFAVMAARSLVSALGPERSGAEGGR